MKRLKIVVKKAIIMYMIIYLLLASLSSCYARKYDAKCGEYVSQYARDFIEKYCTPTETKTRYVAIGTPNWTGGAFGKGIFEACCNTGVKYMYELALGVNLMDYGWVNSCSSDVNGLGNYPQYWEDVTNQTLQPGDIVLSSSHTEMYVGNNENANFGNSPHSGKITNGPRLGTSFTKAYRPKFDCNPTGSIPVDELEEEDLSIYDDNGFIYKGVASVESYESSMSLGKWIITMLTEILDYLIGILTLGVRIVIVGWTAIIERFVIDGIVNAVTGVTNKKDEDWVKQPEDEIDQQAEEDRRAEEAAAEPIQPIGNENNPSEYIGTGVQQVARIGGNAQLKTSSEANVTIENIVYNKIPILDVNFFNFEEAGGSVVDKDGVIYIIKENVAMWYYIFRVMAIVIMLIVLIYVGIKMALTTVTEKKAVYKEVLVSWIAGFIIVLTIHYIMFAIININEEFISWVIPKNEDGIEVSMYETIRTKAYSLKATTGFIGMFMYIVLVYYSIRFLIVYFKRFLTVTVLALMSPFVAVSYAVEKANKNGKGGDIFGNWFADFLYSVILQSIHALIYTLFIQTALELTQTSFIGVLLAFIFLHWMVRIDKVVRKIFGFDKGKSAGKIALGDIKATKEIAKEIKRNTKGAKKLAASYGNYLGNTVGRPFGYAGRRIGDAINRVHLGDTEIDMTEEEQQEQLRREQARDNRRQRRQETMQAVGEGAKASLSLAKTVGLGALVVPALIAEPYMAADVVSAAVHSADRTKELFRKFGDQLNRAKPTTAEEGDRYHLTGIQPRSRRAAENIAGRLDALGGGYHFDTGRELVGVPVHGAHNGANGEPENIRVDDLNDTQRRTLEARLEPGQLRLINGNMSLEEVQQITGDVTKTEEYATLVAEAQALEKEIEVEYQSLTAEIDKQIAEAERTMGPEFAQKLHDKLKKQLKNTIVVMSKPLSEKDIFRAMQNYKSKVPQFDPNAALSQADMTGITKEINAILASKGQGIIMTKEFILKVEKELTESQRKNKEEAERRRNSNYVGQDMSGMQRQKESSVVDDDVLEMDEESGKAVRRKSLKERVKEGTGPDLFNPNAESNPNAPKQDSAGRDSDSSEGATERLVRNIVNASKGPVGKSSPTASPRHQDLTKKLDQLRALTEQMAAITGQANEFSIEDVYRRLEAI